MLPETHSEVSSLVSEKVRAPLFVAVVVMLWYNSKGPGLLTALCSPLVMLFFLSL